ncbi:MAG: membrane protein insertase YidC, partial [Micropepsaceae bacterium]
MNKQPESRNLIAAVLLSVLVLAAWQYFVEAPRIEAQRQRLAAERAAQTETTTAPAIPGAPTSAPEIAPPPRDTLIATGGARLKFDNDKIDGSIRLTGAQIDDLRLKQYRETIDPKSPEIVFLTPQGT